MPNKNDAKEASTLGFQATGGATHDAGAPLDESWRNKGSGMHGIDLDESASLAADEKMKETRKRILDTGGLTLADLGMPGPAARQMGSGLEQAAGNVAQDLMHQGFNNPTPDEAALLAEAYGAPSRSQAQGSWQAQKFMARVKGVDHQVPVWKVLDEDTGMEVPTIFRVQEPADRAAAILNESGNLNDPRFKNLIKNYNEHVRLMKESRQLRRAIKEGRTNLKGKLQEVLGELESVNYKIGI